MKGKDILGTLSPAYGIATGRGAFGAMAPGLGLIPALIDRNRRKRDAAGNEIPELTADATADVTAQPGMRKGGKVKKMTGKGKVSSASKRADGICKKGKTKGRFV